MQSFCNCARPIFSRKWVFATAYQSLTLAHLVKKRWILFDSNIVDVFVQSAVSCYSYVNKFISILLILTIWHVSFDEGPSNKAFAGVWPSTSFHYYLCYSCILFFLDFSGIPQTDYGPMKLRFLSFFASISALRFASIHE